MHPLMFGALTATALFVPIIGHAEGVAIWLMDLVRKIDEWGDNKKIEKEKKDA